jgi:hypothetical protein
MFVFQREGLKMNRVTVLGLAASLTVSLAVPLAVSALLSETAAADEVRHIMFASALIGTWAQTAEQCAANDKSNIHIEGAKYGDGAGSCDVGWIVETAAPHGTNYAVHATCTSASLPPKTQVVNILIRPKDQDHALMGRSFEDLKTYQRCPAG